MVAPHLPRTLADRRALDRVAPGCYRVGPSAFPFLWISANELPLRDELIPFLLVRSGRPLDELCLWLEGRRPPSWLERVVEFLPMSAEALERLAQWVTTKSEDPEVAQRKLIVARAILKRTPDVEKVAALATAERMLRLVLAHKNLVPTPEEDTRIEACWDQGTLERWLDQAIDARSVAEALR